MDIEMKVEEITPDSPIWDIKVEDNIVPIISGDREDVQIATLAAFLQLGSIPQLPDMGVSWTDYLTGDKTFGELDAQIRQSIRMSGKTEYMPIYSIIGDRLTLNVGKEMR